MQSVLSSVVSSAGLNQPPEGTISRHHPNQVLVLAIQKLPHQGSFAFPLSPPHKRDPIQTLLAVPLSTFSSLPPSPEGATSVEENKDTRWLLGERLGLRRTCHFKLIPV